MNTPHNKPPEYETGSLKQQEATNHVDLSPAKWGEGEVEKYRIADTASGIPSPLVTSRKAMICGTSGASAIRSGLEALKQGGTAADAVLTAALAQIVLDVGATVSHAGYIDMVYYSAPADKVFSMSAGYNSLYEEDDPLSIPSPAFVTYPYMQAQPEPKGRSVPCSHRKSRAMS